MKNPDNTNFVEGGYSIETCESAFYLSKLYTIYGEDFAKVGIENIFLKRVPKNVLKLIDN